MAAQVVGVLAVIIVLMILLRGRAGPLLGEVITWSTLTWFSSKALYQYLVVRREATVFVVLCARKNLSLYGQPIHTTFGLHYDIGLALESSRQKFYPSALWCLLKQRSASKPDENAKKSSTPDRVDVIVTFERTAWMLHSFPLHAQGSLDKAVYQQSTSLLTVIGLDGSEEIIDSVEFNAQFGREMRKCDSLSHFGYMKETMCQRTCLRYHLKARSTGTGVLSQKLNTPNGLAPKPQQTTNLAWG